MTRPLGIRFLFLLFVVLPGSGRALLAQAPSIAALAPQAVKPGETVDLTIRGSGLAGATDLWTSFPAQAVLAPDVPNNGKDAASVVFRVAVPADAPLGVHALRVTTPGGTSPLRLIVVDDLPSVAANGSNVAPASAQPISTLVAVDGTTPSLGINFYSLKAAAGDCVSIDVLARRIGSPMDPMVRILDLRGRELAYSDDEPGLNSDAQLAYTFRTAGEYLIEVRDINYRGGGNFFYRLRVGDFPCLTVPYPLSAKRGTQVSLGFAGSDTQNVSPVTLTVPSDPLVAWLPVGAKRVDGKSSGFVTLGLDDADGFLETEPNNAPADANRVNLGATVNGRLTDPSDVDRFIFKATKGQQMTFLAVTRVQNSPCDLVLRIHRADGAQLAEADDAEMQDAVLPFTFPEDGDYTLAVIDRAGRGDERFAYRVTARPTQVGFKLSASADALNIPAGGVEAITVTSVRAGYDGPINVSVAGLPAGLASVPTVIGPGRNSVVLTVRADAGAQTARPTPVRIVGRASINGADYEAAADIQAALSKQFNGIFFPPPQLELLVAAAAAPKPAFALIAEPGEIVFGPNLKATVKVKAARAEGIDEAITLAVNPAEKGLPDGITAAVQPIAKGANEVDVVFTANDKVKLGDYTGVLSGAHKKGDATTSALAAGITLKIQPALAMSLSAGPAKIAKGQQLTVKAVASRNPALAGDIAVTFQNLPPGVTAAAAVIPAAATEVDVVLTAAQDAKAGSVDNLTVTGEMKVGETKFAATSAPVALTVE